MAGHSLACECPIKSQTCFHHRLCIKAGRNISEFTNGWIRRRKVTLNEIEQACFVEKNQSGPVAPRNAATRDIPNKRRKRAFAQLVQRRGCKIRGEVLGHRSNQTCCMHKTRFTQNELTPKITTAQTGGLPSELLSIQAHDATPALTSIKYLKVLDGR